jgi:superfamily I DNA/RNA helicase
VRDLLQDEKPAGVAALCERMERVWDERELPDARLAAAMAAYDEELRRLGAADVGSLVHRVLVLFREDAGLAAEFSRRFGAIAVDELQDINLPQYELLKALVAPGTAGGAPGGGASTAAPVLAIGDPDQSIYGFRGSDRDLFFRFRAEPGTRSFGLARNYRSTSTIVEAAEAVVAGERTPGLPPLGSSRGPGQKIRLAHPAHPEEEGRFIAGWIRDLVGGVDSVSVDAARSRRMGATERPGHYSFSDIAVLFRSRAVRDALLPGLLAAGLPLSTGVAAPLTEEEPFLSIAAVLRLLADPSDSVSIRILTARAGTLETQRPMEWLSGNRGDLDQVLGERGIAAVMDRIAASAVPVDRSDPTIALGYETLRAAAEPFGPDLRGFLAHASSCTREGEGTRPVERISLLTFHAAKGLEFPVVFIAGAEDAVTPGARATAGELAEERRLFYVAMTRARDMLLVSHCARRREHGEVVPASPSRFLADIPARCRTDEDRPRRDRDAQLPLFG